MTLKTKARDHCGWLEQKSGKRKNIRHHLHSAEIKFLLSPQELAIRLGNHHNTKLDSICLHPHRLRDAFCEQVRFVTVKAVRAPYSHVT